MIPNHQVEWKISMDFAIYEVKLGCHIRHIWMMEPIMGG